MSGNGPCQSRFGFDLVTTLVGSGTTLLVSAAALRFGDRLPNWTLPEIYGAAGAALLAVGVLTGILYVAAGWR
jgi:hypothetical protein